MLKTRCIGLKINFLQDLAKAFAQNLFVLYRHKNPTGTSGVPKKRSEQKAQG
jgi:hypothetical protein